MNNNEIKEEKGVKLPSKEDQPLKILELFGGIGAPRKALQNLGFKLKSLDYVEVLPYAVQAYNSIFDCGYDPQDIRLWNMHPDVVIHGSPCQDFSKEGRNDINTGRSILYERTLQILDPKPADGSAPELARQPRVVIWENVPNLVSKRHFIHMQNYLDRMKSFGYHNYFKILKASDYKSPQDRERVYTVSLLDERPFLFPEKQEMKWTLKDFIDKSVDFDEYPLTPAEKDILFKLPTGQWAVKEGTKQGYAVIEDWNIINVAFPNSKTRRGRVGKYAKTITTCPRQAIYYDGRFRMLTAKECMRLMGFKDRDYDHMIKAGISETQVYHLAGNSICVPVLEALFRQLQGMNII